MIPVLAMISFRLRTPRILMVTSATMSITYVARLALSPMCDDPVRARVETRWQDIVKERWGRAVILSRHHSP